MTHAREEVEATIQRYIAVRDEIDAGRGRWADLAQFFTDDAVFVDPAWGRVEGLENMRASVFGEAMVGLDDWKFPTEFYAINGDQVLVKWLQIMPGAHADGTPLVQSGCSTMLYAGDGKFSYEEDLLNMVHVIEDFSDPGFVHPPSMNMPPAHPVRDFSRPAGLGG